MDRLFITIKDRPNELAILCKSLLHSDMFSYIKEVVFLDDNSEDEATIQRIYSAFMFHVSAQRIKCRFIQAKDGRSGINESWDRIKYYKSHRYWGLNGDFMVFENYFKRCSDILAFGKSTFGEDKPLFVSGFNTPMHKHSEEFIHNNCIKALSVGGCSFVFEDKDLDSFLSTLNKPTINRGFDLHLGQVFDNILTSSPSVSQHLGFLTGLNQQHLSGFPGAFASIRG